MFGSNQTNQKIYIIFFLQEFTTLFFTKYNIIHGNQSHLRQRAKLVKVTLAETTPLEFI